MRALLPCAILLCAAAAPLHAETYKWVDEKGVTNYASTPPSGKLSKAKIVEERISVVPSDPSLGPAIAAMRARADRQAEYAQAEWLQRQRFALAAQTSAAYAQCPYRADCGTDYDRFAYPYYYPPVVVVRGLNRFLPVHMRTASFSAGRTGMMRSPREPFR